MTRTFHGMRGFRFREQGSCFSYFSHILMHNVVSTKTKSPPASLPLIGWVVQRTTVNWLIADFLLTRTCD